MAVRGELIDNKYEILREIGHGGMSVVYLAMDKHLNKQWAIKEISKNASSERGKVNIKALRDEANLMKKLDHPSLPRIVDIIENQEKIYVVMDYVEGESLDKILKKEGAQSQEQVIEWAKQLCEALAYLHKQNPPIIYRDMKPANIMLKPEGNLKLIDFGIAREYKEENISDTVNLGTRGYAAPEQFDRKCQTDARTDIYCLGATLYHIVTGHNPAEEPYVMYPIRTWNPLLSSGLEYIIAKCTQANPQERFQNCDELLYALEHYNEVDDEFRKKEKKKIGIFSITLGLSIIFLISGFIFSGLKRNENNKDYEQKISISTSTQYDEKVKTYKEAIALYPYRTDAYIKLLEAYSENNSFGNIESNDFMTMYNASFNDANKDKYDSESEQFAELNYELGITYLYLYSSSDDQGSSLKVNALKAQPFFENVASNDSISDLYENYGLAQSYNILCSFYKNYISNTKNTKEPTTEVYSQLIDSFRVCIDNLDKYDYDNIAYIKLTVYESLLDLMQTQRKGFASTGIDKNNVLQLMNDIYCRTTNLAVTQEKSLEKQRNILNNKNDYISNIETVYTNSEERR